MRILLDQDQVLARWAEKVLDWYNDDRKTNIRIEDISSYYEMNDILGKPFVDYCIMYPGFYEILEPVPDAVECVKNLIARGHDVCIVSAVPKYGVAYEGKLNWLRMHMPFFNLDNFISCARKELISGDMLLDDAAHNTKAFMTTGKRAVLFNCPWNRNAKNDEYTARVRDWKHFMEYVVHEVLKDDIINSM